MEEEKINELISGLIEPLKKLQQLQLERLKIEEEHIKIIMKNRIQSESEIEKVLDKLLDLAYWYGEEIEETYYSLLNYFKNINQQSSEEYEKYYIDIIMEDEKNTKNYRK